MQEEPGNGGSGVPYADQQRRIYRYEVGGVERRADPLATLRRIRAAQREVGADLNEAQKAVVKIEEGQAQGVEFPSEMIDHYYDSLGQIAEIGRIAFRVPPAEQDEGGWTDAEALAALSDFFAWTRETREDFTSTPSPAASTASDSTGSATGPAAASLTGPSSASG